MLDLLRRGNEREVGGRVVELLALLDHFFAFFEQPLHALAGLALGGSADQGEHLFQAARPAPSSLRDGARTRASAPSMRAAFTIFGSALTSCPSALTQIAELLDQQLFDHVGVAGGARRAIVDARLAAACLALLSERLERRRLDQLQIFAFVPRTARIDLAVFARRRWTC